MKILVDEIENILGFKIDNDLKERILEFDYSFLTKKEMDDYLIKVIDVLCSDIVKSGEHRMLEWENGWKENLNIFKETKDINSLIPKYHGKNKMLRWRQNIITSELPNLDYKLHICLVDVILRHYLQNVDNVFEFGCGPAYHLIRYNNFNPKTNLYGGDWAVSSQEIIKEINSILNLEINGFNFNFFKPDYNINIPKNSGIYTVAALEQVGENFTDFIDFLIKKNPTICVHMEPIDELLNESNLIDNLSIKYFRKRNYLKGFLPYLEKLEQENKIEIIKKQRIYSGSFFIEGHSLIVWKPKEI